MSVATVDPGQVPSWHSLLPEQVLQQQGSDTESGLSAQEVSARTAKYGPNRFEETKGEARWQAFLRQYKDPMQIVLLGAGIA